MKTNYHTDTGPWTHVGRCKLAILIRADDFRGIDSLSDKEAVLKFSNGKFLCVDAWGKVIWECVSND